MENNNEQSQGYSLYEATEEVNIGYAILSFFLNSSQTFILPLVNLLLGIWRFLV